jgi:hypothetical protein
MDTLEALRLYVSIAETGSLSAAARQVSVSTSTVATHPDDYIVRTRRVDTSLLDLEPSPFLPHDSYRDIAPRFHVGVRHYQISLAYFLMGGNLHHWKKFILPRSAANPRLAPEG